MPDAQGPQLWKYQPQDFEAVTVSNSSTPLTAAKAGAAFLAEVTVEVDEIRYRKDGGAPTTQLGVLAGPGEKFYLWSVEITGFRGIAVTNNARVQVQYYGPRTGVRDYKA